MRDGSRRDLPLALFVLFCGSALLSPARAQGGQGGDPPSAAPESVPALEERVRTTPDDLAARLDLAQALLRLDRCREAAQVAYERMEKSLPLRYAAARSLLRLGYGVEAIQVGAPLMREPGWAERGYALCAEALLCEGRENDAKGLLYEAMQKVPGNSVPLLRLGLQAGPSPAEAREHLRALIQADPGRKGDYAALDELYAASGAGLAAGALLADLPASVPVREVVDSMEGANPATGGPRLPRAPAPSAMMWGAATYSHEPPRAVTFSDARDTQAVASIRRIVLQARVKGGAELSLALDPGADELLLSPGAAAKLGLRPLGAGAIWAPGAASPLRLERVLLPGLSVGPVVLSDVPALVGGERDALLSKVDGILPLWLLRHWALRYEAKAGKLTFYPAGTSPEKVMGSGVFRVRCAWSGRRPFVEVGLAKADPALCLLDPASPATYLRESWLKGGGAFVTTAAQGVQSERASLGLISAGVAELVPLNLAGTRVNVMKLRVGDFCPPSDLQCGGILGRDVLDLFDLFIDYHADVVAMKAQ